MIAEDLELHGVGAPVAVPEWLRTLIQAVRSEAIKPKDARVKSLWDLLRRRELLRQSPWVKALLQRIWYQGLQARPRPETTYRLRVWLRRWDILPPPAVRLEARQSAGLHPLRPVRPVGTTRPVVVRPVGNRVRLTSAAAVRR
jgi:hypothetical protein